MKAEMKLNKGGTKNGKRDRKKGGKRKKKITKTTN